MKTKSVLTLHAKLQDEVIDVGTKLELWGYEVKLSHVMDGTTPRIVLATTASAATLKKARVPDVTPEQNFWKMMASVGK